MRRYALYLVSVVLIVGLIINTHHMVNADPAEAAAAHTVSRQVI